MATVESYLDEYLDPVADALTPQAAQRILELAPRPEVIRRIEELAEKSDNGALSEAEREELRVLADAGTLIALLKAKRVALLAVHQWTDELADATDCAHRAGERCEYCRLAEVADEWPFHVDHIVARVHGGDDALDNLSWSCTQCNLHKARNFASIDPATGNRIDLFNPRKDVWRTHFAVGFDGNIIGLTSTGRATVRLLDMNGRPQLDLRRELIHQGFFADELSDRQP